MATVCENVFQNKEGWTDLFNFIYQGISLGLEPNNIDNIETVLFLMSQIFGLVYEEMIPKLDAFITTFESFYKYDNFDLKTRTSQVIGEILSIVRKKESKKFKIFIPSILEHTFKCLTTPKQEANLKLCLMSISDLASSEPNILRKWFSDIFILLGKVAEQKDLEEQNLRELSFEIIVTLVESSPKLFEEDKSRLEVFVQMLFKYGLEMETELTEEWTTPKTLSFLEEEVVPEPQLQLCLGMIERICDKINPEHVLKILVNIVQDLLGNDSKDWKYKYAAFMTITSMCEEIEDMSEVKNILPTVFENIKSEHPKIRFACLQVIEVAADQFNPHFQTTYHQELFPVLLQSMGDTILRNQLQCTETLSSFLENIPEEVAKIHCKNALDVLFPILLNEASYVSLKENVINVLSELVSACEDEFKQYSSKCLEILLKVLSFCLTQGKEKTIYGSLLELITKIGPNCEEEYKKIIPDLVNAMITLQNNIPFSTDPIFEYLNSSWEKLIPYIKSDFKNLTGPIIECSLKLVANVPTMRVAENPNKEFDIQALLKDDIQDPKIVKQKIQVNTSETQDYAASISLLCTIMEAFGDVYTSYLENTEKMILPLLTFEANDDIRMEAANAIPYFVDIIKKQGNVEVLHNYSKKYVSALVLALESEKFNGAIACQLDSIGGLVEKVGLFLKDGEIKDLFTKLLLVFDKVEKSRLELINDIKKTTEEIESDKKQGHNKINSDDEDDGDEEDILDDMDKDVEEIEDVLVSIADVMGSMFKTHKELTIEVVKLLLEQLLPKYFEKTASSFEVKMGLFIVDDMIEFLGQGLLADIWDNLAKLILTYCDDKEPFLRQAAVYGIGEFAVNTVKNYSNYAGVMIEGIEKALRYSQDGQLPDSWDTARDNAVSALGKIIKYQNASINVPELMKKWVENLPLTKDEIEAQKQHKIFVELLKNSCDLVIGSEKENLAKVIRIICRVADTNLVDDATNKEIKELITGMKSNQQFASYIETSFSEAKKELKEKMQELFK
eukprot:CAMPEP_0170535624 /NCGR_PEP_ID=MMETSP0209-20121228/101705_1 /TAXON_ID=665100 ORGANISM="Litonotus pictus, Strain P1" /NCGR_SAMPLE_ID=MMETSP0209 /ASSEMBLY_ACC=CAM_ASM_000301 /LENGTH=1014 /DNA_ID=CAMNT_0010836917 /DNA_START=614 /DNA_END=3658 /DNA_ORIENTATION=-